MYDDVRKCLQKINNSNWRILCVIAVGELGKKIRFPWGLNFFLLVNTIIHNIICCCCFILIRRLWCTKKVRFAFLGRFSFLAGLSYFLADWLVWTWRELSVILFLMIRVSFLRSKTQFSQQFRSESYEGGCCCNPTQPNSSIFKNSLL